ncbi:MAG: methyltransferase family protein [Gammaproteobacteria bacterium]|jgi:cyclopropane fatty-acyl-phospholipid synthase-like methyltransferase|nr:methyltransferase family protein [Gammaproteobacteria bacterium]
MSAKQDSKNTWENKDNADYYEKVPHHVLRQYPIKGGLENGCDIDLIFPYIINTTSLIEAGAGYGRVIRNLIDRGYQGKIYALERSQNLCNHLKNEFHSQVNVICDDVQTYIPSEKVDAVLFMWSTISDFPKSQYLKLLTHTAKWLKPEGICIIETISHLLIPHNTGATFQQSYAAETEYGTLKGYLPSSEEIEAVATQLEFKVKKVPYQSETGRDRIIHILSR